MRGVTLASPQQAKVGITILEVENYFDSLAIIFVFTCNRFFISAQYLGYISSQPATLNIQRYITVFTANTANKKHGHAISKTTLLSRRKLHSNLIDSLCANTELVARECSSIPNKLSHNENDDE